MAWCFGYSRSIDNIQSHNLFSEQNLILIPTLLRIFNDMLTLYLTTEKWINFQVFKSLNVITNKQKWAKITNIRFTMQHEITEFYKSMKSELIHAKHMLRNKQY